MKMCFFSKFTNIIPPLFVILILVGCKRREELLYGYGTLAFIMFILLALTSILLHYWHTQSWFQQFRILSQKIVLPLSFIAIPIGTIMSLLHLSSKGTRRLGIFIGVVIAVLFYCLQRWAMAKDIEKQRLYTKIAQLCLSFLIVLIFLYFGGKGLK